MTESRDSSRLQAVVDTAVDGVILIDGQGSILLFNPACERLFGYRAEEVIGQNVKLLMPEPFRGEHDGYLGNYRRTGERKIIGIGREVVGRRRDGTTFPMDLSVGETTEDGRPIFVGIIHDLTSRKQSEQAVRDVASRLRAVVETAVDGVILIDARGSILMFNPACERLFGYRDGSTFPMDLSVGEAALDDGSIFVGIIHDLTERKRTGELLVQAQKMEAVGQLSGGIAHDFNNLLTVIIGNAESLGERLQARPDLKRMADTVVSAGARGAELTQRLLAFSRRQMLVPTEIDCNRLVGMLRELFKRTLREDIEIRTELEPNLWRAFADAGQLESAILNLALNAQDAMPKGGSLAITTANVPLDERYRSAYPEVKTGRYVMVSVTDSGEGMPDEVRERAFEPFFTTKDVGRGSGLGLSMVYGFIKQSNGHVAIYSEPGLGTAVRLYLPAAASSEATTAPTLFKAEPDSRGGPESVLVAEDDPFVRGYAVACLESLGYRVIEAVDGHDAMTRLASEARVDLLFTDVVMPGGISGLELADKARALKPGIKVLLTSGYALETLLSRGRLQGETVVLNKPYRKADLARRLREILDA